MPRPQDGEKKKRIIEAAERLFASQGFHGTSVEEIAAQASVNKATIYYYFDSKQAILDYLIDGFLNGFVQTAKNMLSTEEYRNTYRLSVSASNDWIHINGEEGLQIMLGGFFHEWMDQLFSFFEEKRNILRIMVSESVLDGDNRNILFKLSDIIASAQEVLPEQFQAMGIEKLNDQLVVMKFFGGILPIAYFAICSETWQEHYHMSKEMLKSGMEALFQIELLGYAAHFQQT